MPRFVDNRPVYCGRLGGSVDVFMRSWWPVLGSPVDTQTSGLPSDVTGGLLTAGKLAVHC